MVNIFLHPTFIEKFPWAQFPPILARSPLDHDEVIKLRLSSEFIVGNLHKNNRTPIYQSWAHLVGTLPPLPNIAFMRKMGIPPTLTTLEWAHACFRGVERPLGSDLKGGSVYIYILKVSVTLRFDHAPPVSIPVVHRLDPDLALAVMVERADGLQVAGESLWGTALKVELIETDPADHDLPIDHEGRYDERLW